MTSKFKIGDWVQRKIGSGRNDGIGEGEPFKVTRVIAGGSGLVSVNGSHDAQYLEHAPCQPEVEESWSSRRSTADLIAAVNAGYQALALLLKVDPAGAEYRYTMTPRNTIWYGTAGIWYGTAGLGFPIYEFRVKPKPPQWTDFTTGGIGGWNVCYNAVSGGLSIGCQTFAKAEHVLLALKAARDGEFSFSFNGGETVRAGRDGVLYKTHLLPWADVDTVIAALEKVFKGKE